MVRWDWEDSDWVAVQLEAAAIFGGAHNSTAPKQCGTRSGWHRMEGGVTKDKDCVSEIFLIAIKNYYNHNDKIRELRLFLKSVPFYLFLANLLLTIE